MVEGPAPDSPNLGARLGAPIKRLRPDFDMDVWRAKRRIGIRSELRALRDLDHQLRNDPQDTHLVVIPNFGPNSPTWYTAGQNHFFEVWRSAQEILGEDRVTLVDVNSGHPAEDWHRKVLEVIADTKASHVIAQIESDPNRIDQWSWDVIGNKLAKHWQGVFIGVMHDAAFPWLRMKARYLGSIIPNFLVAEMCEPMAGVIKPGRYEVGPMTMPFSQETVRAISAHVADAPKLYQLTFIGALYDYRVELIRQLRASGVDVAVNPHRSDAAGTYAESQSNRPRYLDYMKALAQSEMTINFSLASGGPTQQYKIRVQEASMVGCLCLTDDVDRTRHFFAPNEYEYFPSLEAIPQIVSERLADPVRLRADQQSARSRAQELARTDFWGRIEDGLLKRRLRPLTGISPPIEP